MPTPYEKLEFKQLLHHKLAYECIDKKGTELIESWDMVAFEKAIVTENTLPFPISQEQLKMLKQSCSDLNESMPYLEYSEKGQHYGYELFSFEPEKWFSRGGPLYWAYLSRKFTLDKLPIDDNFLQEKYRRIADENGISKYPNRQIYIERFAAGGMSSGIVCSDFVNQQKEVLRKRNRAFGNRNEEQYAGVQYVDKAIERISYLCSCSSMRNWYVCNPEIEFNKLLFVLESLNTNWAFRVVSSLWGIFTGIPLSVAETAKMYEVTNRRIYQIERNVWRNITKNPDWLLVFKSEE